MLSRRRSSMLRLEWVFLNFLLFSPDCLFCRILKFCLCYTDCWVLLHVFGFYNFCLLIVLSFFFVWKYLTCRTVLKIFGTVVFWYFSCCQFNHFGYFCVQNNIETLLIMSLSWLYAVNLNTWKNIAKICETAPVKVWIVDNFLCRKVGRGGR